MISLTQHPTRLLSSAPVHLLEQASDDPYIYIYIMYSSLNLADSVDN